MKNTFLLFVLVLVATATFAQSGGSTTDFALTLNRKIFHTNDTVSIQDLTTLGQESFRVLDRATNQQYQPATYKWLVSVNDSSDTWTGTYSADPAATNHDGEARLHRTLQMTKPGDLIFISDLTYTSGALATLPKSFAFIVR